MKKKETVKCPNCGREYDKKGIIYHKKTCDTMYKIKEDLISDYYILNNYNKVANKYKLRKETVREYLHVWGVKFNKTSNIGQVNARPRKKASEINKSQFNENYFDTMDEKRYWILGLLASDGNVCKNNNVISLAQSGIDGEKLIRYYKRELGIKNKIRNIKTSGRISHSVYFSSKKVKEMLATFNIVPAKTYDFDYPDIIPNEFVSAFIAGYIEGDGCISKHKNKYGTDYLSVSFVGTPKFIDKCHEVIPIKGSVSNVNHSFVKCISWSGLTAIELCDWLYSYDTLYHSYKYNNYITMKAIVESSNYYKRKKAHDEVLKLFEDGNIQSYSEIAEKFGVKRDLVRNWIYNAYKSGKVTRDYRYLRNT